MDRHAVDCLSTIRAAVPCKADAAPSVNYSRLYPFFLFRFMLTLELMVDAHCIFCKIITGQIPARIIAQNNKAIAFLDANPLAKAHTLIIPRSHYQKIQDLDKEHLFAVFELLFTVTGAVEMTAGVNASTLAIHNGREAGQDVPHLHIHIIPRKATDGAGAIHTMFKKKPSMSSAELDLILQNVKANLV
jgi:histidine triad (HIT) family protein